MALVDPIQIAIAAICMASFVLYNSREEILFRSKLLEMKSSVKKILERRRNSRRKAILSVVELVLFFALIYLAFTMKIFWAVVVSNSMAPTFERGDMVLVQTLFVNPEKGDIVMFERSDLNLPVTHRVLKVEDGLVYTGGDASGPDARPVPRDKIIGEVVTIFGSPVVVKGVGKYFILDATQLRDITPFGQEYLFYKNLIELFRKYAIAIIVISIAAYVYLTVREFTA
ncbi:MAG: signal peptidase I [Archaeoglobi archaeon]|nr:signal peptidase I [Archaeoglobi archaeon]